MKISDGVKVFILNWEGIEKVWKIVFENVSETCKQKTKRDTKKVNFRVSKKEHSS